MISFSGRWGRCGGWVAAVFLGLCACGGDGGETPARADRPPVREAPDPAVARQVDQAIEQFPEEIREVVERLNGDRIRLGTIEIDPGQGTICFDGLANMNEGLVEVMICTPWGKTHESLFVADVRPMFLHASCLLLGLRHGRNPTWRLSEDDPDLSDVREEPPGNPIDIMIRWEDARGAQEAPIGRFLMDENTGKTLVNAPWVFVGSYIDPTGVYAADKVGSIVTNFHDFSAMIDLALDRGQIDDFMVANTAAIPEPGTPVRITIKRHSKQKESER